MSFIQDECENVQSIVDGAISGHWSWEYNKQSEKARESGWMYSRSDRLTILKAKYPKIM